MRLSELHASRVGAHEPSSNRLYELTVGARSTVISGIRRSSPAMKPPNTDSSPNAFSSPRHRLMWMWQLDPACPENGFAMKVTLTSPWSAISFIASFISMCRSAMSQTSAYRMFISCWPLPHSPFDVSTGMPDAVRWRRTSAL